MTSDAEIEEALENCSKEQIHIPGTVQSYGVLVATDEKLTRFEFVSESANVLLGIHPTRILGKPISLLFDHEEGHQIRNCLSHSSITEQRETFCEKSFAGNRFQISVYRSENRPVFEFLPVEPKNVGEQDALKRTRTLLAESVGTKDFQEILNNAVTSLRVSTAYDRVKAYRFLPDGSGEVVAESRAAHTESFMGHRFPASDIPPVAKTLYSKTPIRVLSDLFKDDCRLLALDPLAPPLDMSLAVLRGTSTVHVQYLRNMGVKSTMTLPITVDGELWGLFAFHHMKPMVPDPTLLVAVELSGKMLSLIIQHAKQTRHKDHLFQNIAIANEFLGSDDSRLANDDYWKNHSKRLTDAIASDGFAYIQDQNIELGGSAPNQQACMAIRDYGSSSNEDILCFDDLADRFPDETLGDTGGALVLSLSENANSCLILFRNLTKRTIEWAGNPTKNLKKTSGKVELTPRSSFEQYIESVEDRSEEWTNDDVEIAQSLKQALTRALDSRAERIDSQRRLKIMVQELNHRVRNILTLVQSMSSGSMSSATSLETYAISLEQRIVALAGAHDLLTHADMQGIELLKIAELELKPFIQKSKSNVTLTGPSIILNAEVSPIFALLLHELTSNSVKHGALSSPQGHVEFTWSLSAGELHIHWNETGGPKVEKPEREGFGRSIIESAIPYELGGTAELIFEPSGVQAQFTIPGTHFNGVVPTDGQVNAHDTSPSKKTEKESVRRGLIVEDNYLIAKESMRLLSKLGFTEVAAAGSIEQALQQLHDSKFDFCLLDVNLHNEMSEPVANQLAKLGIPYAFASGYGSEGAEICNHFNAPFLTKPFSLKALQAVLMELGFNNERNSTNS